MPGEEWPYAKRASVGLVSGGGAWRGSAGVGFDGVRMSDVEQDIQGMVRLHMTQRLSADTE